MLKTMKERVLSILERGRKEEKIPGACVGVWRAGREILSVSCGLADVEKGIPMQKDALFRLFSMTKPVTSLAAMMLWEQGLLQLDDEVSKYIPSFQKMQVAQNGVLVPARREILVQDLLNMTAGIANEGTNSVSQLRIGQIYAAREKRADTENPMTTQEFATLVGEAPLLFQPGEKWFYGAAADVLGAVLEQAADMPLDTLFREMIFSPLGMTDTDFFIPPEKYPRLAQQYKRDAQGHLCPTEVAHLGVSDYRKKPAFLSAGAGLVTTMADYAKFANCLAGRGTHRAGNVRLLGEHTWRYMTAAKLTPSQRSTMDWPQLRGYSYGNLLRVLDDPAARFTNAPKGEFGWDAWTGSYLSVSPLEDETVLLYFIQVLDGSSSDVVWRLRAAAFGTEDLGLGERAE